MKICGKYISNSTLKYRLFEVVKVKKGGKDNPLLGDILHALFIVHPDTSKAGEAAKCVVDCFAGRLVFVNEKITFKVFHPLYKGGYEIFTMKTTTHDVIERAHLLIAFQYAMEKFPCKFGDSPEVAKARYNLSLSNAKVTNRKEVVAPASDNFSDL